MDFFKEKDQQWFVEAVSLLKVAKNVGTPTYVYSKAALIAQWQAFDNAFQEHPHQVNYAVKANSNLAVLNTLAKLGSGFDIVSGGELARVLKAGGDPKRIIFSGVGKTYAEISEALQAGVGCMNVESEAELKRINDIATHLQKKATIAIRVNPDVDAKSHPYISTGLKENKFGVAINEAKRLYILAKSLPHLQIQGIAFHIGSQILSVAPFVKALQKILALIQFLNDQHISISHLNVGGGLGVRYQNETPPSPTEYVTALLSHIKDPKLTIHVEPGRAISANAGVLLTRVEYIKESSNQDKPFAIVDAGMNDLLRPALYQAWQDIVPITKDPAIQPRTYDIVGPVCETADFLGKDRSLALQEGTVLMIHSAGAYGFSMSSNYNARPRAAEVMVDGDSFYVVRKRENIADLYHLESLLTPS